MVHSIQLKDLHRELIREDCVLTVPRQFLGQQHRPEGYFSETWNGAPHAHVLLFLLHGQIDLLGESELTVKPGQMIFSGPHRQAGWRFSKDSLYLELWFKLEIGAQPAVVEEAQEILAHPDNIEDTFARTIARMESHGQQPGLIERHHLAMVMAHFCDRRGGLSEEGTLDGARKTQLFLYLQDHLSRNPSPLELASAVGLSPDYFTRIFKKTFGQAPKMWILSQRLQKAAVLLLEENLSVSQVAYGLGWENPALFSRQFTKLHGCSPSEFRRRSRGGDLFPNHP